MDREKLIAALLGNTGAAFGTGSPAEEAQKPSGLAALFGGAYNALGDLSKRAIGNSQTAIDTGNYNPAPALEAAMLPMGTGAVAGVPVKGAEAVLGAGPIRAYHGSPHDFDHFDLSKIGTGEGAQAYGHGLYFAEEEKVADEYRRRLARNNQRPTATPGGVFGNVPILEQDPTRPGRMYEVNINADPAHFLDWDKPLAGQSDVAQRILQIPQVAKQQASQTAFLGADKGLTGSSAYAAGTGWRRGAELSPSNPAAFTETLREAGIPGIKYLDQGSRGAGQGSSNYVVFNDKLIDILKKYGLAGIAIPPGLAGIQTGDQTQ